MNINQAIASVIEKANKPSDAKEINFHWDEANQVWCLSGTTVDGLYFETDDIPAKSRRDAEEQAIAFLMS